jgi:hypothetical protein
MKIVSTVLLAACVATALAGERKFTDPEDGQFDMSQFLATAYGFMPIGSIITEPAVGYGSAWFRP